MKVYLSKRAPNPRRVAWVLAEKAATDVEIIDIDLLKGEHRTESFLGKVGIANVPALELDNGTVITESVAICRYLESLYPEPNLFGVSPEEVAVIEMWTRRTELMLAMPLMLTVRHTHPALAVLEQQSPEMAERNRTAAERALRFFDRQLAAHAFMAGDRLTIADIVAFIGFDFARMVRFTIPETTPNLLRWAEAMRARPAAAVGV
jgi:glutathione S-transferase